MDHLLDDEEDAITHHERELTLSTGAILGIFFCLVLLCGGFFGFGYKMGSHKAAPIVDVPIAENTPTPSANFNSFKPAAGSPSSNSSSAPTPSPAPATVPPVVDTPAAPPEAAPVVHSTPTAAPPAVQPAAAAGTIYVQVAAITHQEDAELLIGALKAKGYPAAARTQPQDKLFHVQVGPYDNKKDAQTVLQRLQADGYQPFLK